MIPILLVGVCNGYARKELPDHITKLVTDPSKNDNHVPNHDITAEQILAMGKQQNDPHYKKSTEQIPRVPDNYIVEVAEIHPEENKIYFTDTHK